MSRLSYLQPDQLNATQQRIFAAVTKGKRATAHVSSDLSTTGGGLRGPFNAFLHAPEVGDPAQSLGEAIRFKTALPGKLREIAILLVAAQWTAQYEWWAHAKLARDEGLPDAIIDAIKAGTPPPLEDDNQATVYEFTRELLGSHHVNDATYKATVAAIGEQQTVELVSLLGYYTLVSMVLNTFEVPLPEGEVQPF